MDASVTGDGKSPLRNGNVLEGQVNGFKLYMTNNFAASTTSNYYKVLYGHMSSTATANAIAKTEKNIASLNERIANSTDDRVIKRLNQQLDKALARLAKLQGDQAETEGGEGGEGGEGLPSLGDENKSPLKSFADSAFKFAEQAEQAVVNAFKGMEDALVKFVQTGKLNFKDLANSIISDLTRMLVRYAIVQPLFFGMFPGLKPSAKGNVFV